MLRQQLMREFDARFNRLLKAVQHLLVTEDAFGIQRKAAIVNTRFAFTSTAQQVEAFKRWLATQIQVQIIQQQAEDIENAYWRKYIEEGYRKGAGRAFDDTRGKKYPNQDAVRDFYNGTKDEFLRSSFAHYEAVDKVKLLAGRVFTELKGVTDAMAVSMTRTLTDGLVQGKGARAIARDLQKNVEGIGKNRARTIARTEIVRAHAEGQLDALERLGITDVGVAVEWSTAADGAVCDLCAPLEGVVMTISEARGAIPRHPSCRCAYIPANVGESDKGQKRSQRAVRDAINESIKAEIPKRSKRTLAEQKARTSWVMADRTIAKVRAKSILDKRAAADTKIERATTEEQSVKRSRSGLPNNEKEAARIIADSMERRIKENPEAHKGAPSKEQIQANWEKNLKGAFEGLDPERRKFVEQAMRDNKANDLYQRIIKGNTPEYVIFLKATDNSKHAGESIAGVTFLYDQSLMNKVVSSTATLIPGGATSGDQGGLAAELRHEYAHTLWERLSDKTQEQFRNLLLNLSEEDIAKGLTRYAGNNVAMERFCELFATVTDKNYDPKKFPEWVDNAGQFIMRHVDPVAKKDADKRDAGISLNDIKERLKDTSKLRVNILDEIYKEYSQNGGKFARHGMANEEEFQKIRIEGVDIYYTKGSRYNTARSIAAWADTTTPVHENLWKQNKSIVFSTQQNKDDPYWAKKYNEPGFVSYATGGDGHVVVYNTHATESMIAHESGHNLSTNVYGSTYPSGKYAEAQKKEAPVTDYGAKSPAEDFAEACDLYTTQRARFEKQFPEKYKVIKDLLGDKRKDPSAEARDSVLEALGKGKWSIHDVVSKTGMSVADAREELQKLEQAGKVTKTLGGQWQRS